MASKTKTAVPLKKNMPDKQGKNREAVPKTAFKPGQSGNPRGRPPKGYALADLLNDELDRLDQRKKVVRTLITAAVNGDMQAVKIIFDRIDGKARETIDLNATAANPDATRMIIEAALAESKNVK